MEHHNKLHEIWHIIRKYGERGLLVSHQDLIRMEWLFLRGKWFLTPLPFLMLLWGGNQIILPVVITVCIFVVHIVATHFFMSFVASWTKTHSIALRLWELLGTGTILSSAHSAMHSFDYNGAYIIVIVLGVLTGGLPAALILLSLTFPVMTVSSLLVTFWWGERGDYLGTMANVLGHVIIFVCLSFLVLWLVALNNKYRTEAEIDGLTSLFNHRYFYKALKDLWETMPISGSAIVLADLDDFKQINDTYGHLTGDEVLKTIGFYLRTKIPGPHLAARYGGEEFVMFFQNTSAADVKKILQSLQSLLGETVFDTANGPIKGITMSFGVVSEVTSEKSPSDWLYLADQMLYRAKSSGKNRIELAGSELQGKIG